MSVAHGVCPSPARPATSRARRKKLYAAHRGRRRGKRGRAPCCSGSATCLPQERRLRPAAIERPVAYELTERRKKRPPTHPLRASEQTSGAYTTASSLPAVANDRHVAGCCLQLTHPVRQIRARRSPFDRKRRTPSPEHNGACVGPRQVQEEQRKARQCRPWHGSDSEGPAGCARRVLRVREMARRRKSDRR